MTSPNLTDAEVCAQGEKIYRECIRPTLTEADIGIFVTIDINSGDYEIDADDISGGLKLRARTPGSSYYGLRVGYSAAYFFGGYYEEPEL